jgi:TonB family protein
MDHGIAAYFAEQARFARRVTFVTVMVGVGGLGALWAGRTRPIQSAVSRITARIGYEGPNQYVRRINLEQMRGSGAALEEVGRVEHGRTTGGAMREREGTGRPAQRRTRLPDFGEELSASAEHRSGRLPNVPVVQSEELEIEERAMPEYPPLAYAQGIEGRVKLEGLIDTTGRVIDVRVLECEGDPTFGSAASEAIWKFRFHPFLVGGLPHQVYAAFTIRFEIRVKEVAPGENPNF